MRQLYYQFVARDLLPENTMREYKKLGNIVNDARLAGLIDWKAIEDRGRKLEENDHWESPEACIRADIDYYQLDKWANQPHRVEVWVEKDALMGIVESVSGSLDVACTSTRGYTSQSEMWRAARRFKKYTRYGQTCTLLHLSDHDPSGINMTNDIDNRLNHVFGCDVYVKRIALTMKQVKRYTPPPQSGKNVRQPCSRLRHPVRIRQLGTGCT